MRDTLSHDKRLGAKARGGHLFGSTWWLLAGLLTLFGLANWPFTYAERDREADSLMAIGFDYDFDLEAFETIDLPSHAEVQYAGFPWRYFRSVRYPDWAEPWGSDHPCRHWSWAALVGNGGIAVLRGLVIRDVPTGAAAIRHAAALTSLVQLRFANVPVTDDDLPALREFPDLRVLDLRRTAITGAGLTHLRELEQLRALYLPRHLLAEPGLAALRGHPNLLFLNLGVGDEADRPVEELVLTDLPRLRQVYLPSRPRRAASGTTAGTRRRPLLAGIPSRSRTRLGLSDV